MFSPPGVLKYFTRREYAQKVIESKLADLLPDVTVEDVMSKSYRYKKELYNKSYIEKLKKDEAFQEMVEKKI